MKNKTNKSTFLFLLIVFMLLGLICANYYKIQNDKIKAIENDIAEEKRIEELNPSEEIF